MSLSLSMSLENENLPAGARELRVGIRTISYTPDSLIRGVTAALGIPLPSEAIEEGRRLLRSQAALRQYAGSKMPANYFDSGQEALLLTDTSNETVTKFFITNPDILNERLEDLTAGSDAYSRHFGSVAVKSAEKLDAVPDGWEERLFGTDTAVVQTMPELQIIGNALKKLQHEPKLFRDNPILAENMQKIADGTRSMLDEGLWTPDLSPRHNNIVLTEDDKGIPGVSVIDKSPFDASGGKIRPTAAIYDRRAQSLPSHIEEWLEKVT